MTCLPPASWVHTESIVTPSLWLHVFARLLGSTLWQATIAQCITMIKNLTQLTPAKLGEHQSGYCHGHCCCLWQFGCCTIQRNNNCGWFLSYIWSQHPGQYTKVTKPSTKHSPYPCHHMAKTPPRPIWPNYQTNLPDLPISGITLGIEWGYVHWCQLLEERSSQKTR